MPTYEYRCAFCGPFTRFRSIREETATSDCPDCGGAATRVFTIPPVIDRTSIARRARLLTPESSAPRVAPATPGADGS